MSGPLYTINSVYNWFKKGLQADRRPAEVVADSDEKTHGVAQR